MKTLLYAALITVTMGGFFILSRADISALQSAEAVAIDRDDIGGVVTGPKGPEAGVWVIAETTALPTKFAKIAVTDDRGRYVIPDLPEVTFDVWVRGYGLVDSPKVKAAPGKTLNLTAVPAPDARAAAQYYPANYWFSLINILPKSAFPGFGPFKLQAEAINGVKNCENCHQLGDKATREIPKSLGTFESSTAAWVRRVRSGHDGGQMANLLSRSGGQRLVQLFADWTDRIAGGEVPPVPPRPQGRERNVVVSVWDFGNPKLYIHDAVSSYKNDPTVNANGPFIGASEESGDYLYVLDPVRHKASELKIPLRDPDTPITASQKLLAPSPYWGEELVWKGRSNPHSSMWDAKGRLWTASTIRGLANPAWCRAGSNHPAAKAFPTDQSVRELSVYDPKAGQFTLIDTCFNTHHVMFGDKDTPQRDWLFVSAASLVPSEVLGWIDTKKFDETHDEQASVSWTPFVVDTNGNGKRDAYVEPKEPIDPAKDKRYRFQIYSVIQNPIDGAIWATSLGYPGALLRVTLGSNPPVTALTEIFESPLINPQAPAEGYKGGGPRGVDVDRNGVVWTNMWFSGQLASFDRRKCKGVLNGPKATGQQCPEGWTLYPLPGPPFKGITDAQSADVPYLNWVDQYDTFGLGRNVPFALGSGSDSLKALAPDTGKWTVLRVPYPMGFFTKGMDGRIDDPKAGWKGKGVWASTGYRTPWHMEGGKGTLPKAVKFQLRPDPLAK